MPPQVRCLDEDNRDRDRGGPSSTLILPGTGHSRISRLELIGFTVLAAPALLYTLIVFSMIPAHSTSWDFSHYYAAAMVLRAGGDPYTTDLQPVGTRLGLKIDEINRGTYPPTFIWCFSPLTRLPLRVAFFVWQAISIACLVTGLVLLMRETVTRRAAAWLTLGVVMFSPVQLHLAFSQSQFIIFLMLVLAIRALERSRDAQAGLILAAAALLRAYPLAMAGYLIVRRHWRALGWMAAGLVIGGAITLAAIGLNTFLDFRYATAFVTTRFFLEQPANIALGSFISRVFWHLSDHGFIGSHESARKAVAFAVCGAVGIAVAILTWSRDSNEPDQDRRAYSLWIATIILISPTSWIHYLVLLLLPFIQITSAAVAGRVGRSVVMWCIVSYALAEIGFYVFALNGFVRSHSLLTTEMGFMSAAAAWIGIAIFAGAGAAAIAVSPRGLAAASNRSTAVA